MTFKFSLTADIISIDAEKYQQALNIFLLNRMKKAAARFATAALARVPIRTGFAAGAFAPLQTAVGGVSAISRLINSVRGTFSRRKVPRFGAEYYTGSGGRILKTPAAGAQFGTPVGEIFTLAGNTVIFKFDVDITYFRINEAFGGRSPTAPWKAFIVGLQAMIRYLNSEADMNFLPQVSDFIVKRQISI